MAIIIILLLLMSCSPRSEERVPSASAPIPSRVEEEVVVPKESHTPATSSTGVADKLQKIQEQIQWVNHRFPEQKR